MSETTRAGIGGWKPWRIGGRYVGSILPSGTYFIDRVVGGRRARISTCCITREGAEAQYRLFEMNPAGYVNPAGRRAFKTRVRRGTSSPAAYAKMRDWRLRKVHGINEDEYQAQLGAQRGRCAICGLQAEEAANGRLDVDHCHDTGAMRGLLCGPCNRGIGQFADDPERVRAAAAYLDRHRAAAVLPVAPPAAS